MNPTTTAELDTALNTLDGSKNRWATLSIEARINLLQRCMDHTNRNAESWVLAACDAKGIDFDSPLAAEEWLGGPMTTIRNLRVLVETLEQIRDSGTPHLKNGAISHRPNGQLKVEVFPRSTVDKLLYAGFRGEVWMEPGVDENELIDTIASAYRIDVEPEGKVALVLGAGNVSSIGPMDVLHKLFNENQVCLLKMNPVNEYTGPYVERSFRPLIEGGFLRVVYGGADVGEYLVHHDVVDEIHMTGSDFVHDIIAWGAPGEEQETNKANGTPKITKRFTSELGCVTPVIVVPGEWSEKELDFQAANVATMVANNGSFNCNAAKLLVTWEHWPQRRDFLNRVEDILARLPLRKAYYPGSDKKYRSFIDAHPNAKVLAASDNGNIPWTTIFGVDAENKDDIVFNREAWCGILSESPLSGDGAGDFLKNAVDFCNDHVWGTLSCVVIVDPRVQSELGGSLEQAVADLKYGSVAVNHWAAISYGLVYTTWGAYPGHTLDNIVSGIGVVHNALMLEKPQKSVIWGPFTMFPKPPWFATHRNGHKVAKRLTHFEASPSYLRLPGIVLSAMLG